MVTYYPPRASDRPNAVHEQQDRLKRYYHSIAISAVASEMDKVSREIADYYASEETLVDYIRKLEQKAA